MTPEYFLHKFHPFMLPSFFENLDYTDKNLWIANRLQSLMYLQPYLKKQVNQEDLFTLPWDTERAEDRQKAAMEYNKQNIKRLENLLNNKA